MSNAIAMNEINLTKSDTNKETAGTVQLDGSVPQSELLPFGESSTSKENGIPTGLDSNKSTSDYEFGNTLGEFSMSPYADMPNGSVGLDNYYNSSLPMGFQKFPQSHTPTTLSPLPSAGMDDTKLYTRSSLGGMLNFGESAMEPYPHGDLTLTNLQDVMEEDLYPTTNGFSNASSISNSLNPAFPKSSLFGSYNNSFHRNSMGLNSNPNFVLTSYDDDFAHSYNSLTPQASRNSFTPIQPLYMDSMNMMNDFISETSYSPRPRLSPLATVSPRYTDSELSPRRSFVPSSSQSRLLSSEEPRLQRSLSAMGSSTITGGAVDLTYPVSSFKRKDSMKTSWQPNDIDSFRGHIKEMSCDHNGCRTLQQCLDEYPQRIIPIIYEEVGNELTELMMNSFGNYLFQKLLDVSTVEQRRSVLQSVKQQIVIASKNVHGTRSVQKLIQVCKEPDMVKMIMDALKGNIADLSSDANGNHVIQRCLQYMPDEYRTIVFEEVVASCFDISTKRHGCCVVQRCLDSAPPTYHDQLLDTIVENSVKLICDPFGNYVIQYLIEKGKKEESERIARCVLGRVAELSCQKYSSNVIEKIICCAGDEIRGEIVKEIASYTKLQDLLHDKFANYVIQKALKESNPEQKKILLNAIRPYEVELSKSTGGKHILSQLNEIAGSSSSQPWSKA